MSFDFPKRHPVVWTTIILLVVGVPEWMAAVWSLFSDQPLALKVSGWLNMNSLSWSPYWVTIPMGLLMIGYLIYELRFKAKPQDQLGMATSSSSAQQLALNPSTLVSIMFIMLIGLGVWVLIISMKVSSIRSDVNCFVMPRHLSDEQSAKIAKFLSSSGPHEIILNQVEDDEEAGSYRSDFYEVFQKGGWIIAEVNVVPNAYQDIALHYREPLQTPPPREDPKHPSAHTIVAQALRHADLDVGTGSESSSAITKYSLSLTIGHRRHDSFACAEARNKHSQEQLLRELRNQ